jgi:arsenate reductase
MSLRIQLFGTPDCPHLEGTRRSLGAVAEALAPETAVEERTVRGLEDAERLNFPGSPTIRVNGEDVEPRGAGSPPSLACRSYREAGDTPPEWMIEAAVLRACAPQHILFLCVANSARSQMAEGIARALAPASVRVSSAGSLPTTVRPEAMRVLREIDIDAGEQRSKGTEEIDRSVDAVITLCAEEVCPVWLRPARRLHWGLPDPAAESGNEEERLEAFQRVRDELVRRLSLLFR